MLIIQCYFNNELNELNKCFYCKCNEKNIYNIFYELNKYELYLYSFNSV